MKKRGIANMLWGNVKISSGLNGKSAYEIAVQNGFVGTEQEWLASLVGADGTPGYTPQKGVDYFDGNDGAPGAPGYTPQKGIDYFDGAQGPQGPAGADGTKPVQVTGLTLLAANWVTDGTLKKYVLSHASITATSIVEVIPENAAYDILVAAEPRPATESASGSVSMWVKNTPAGDINVIINIYETA